MSIAGLAFWGLSAGCSVADVPPPPLAASQLPDAVALFGKALETIDRNYDGPVDPRTLTSVALKALAASLDGHSSYMTPQEYKDFQAAASGEFAGVGIVLEAGEGGLRIVAPTDGGPAARGGVAAGWQIAAIDGVSAVGMSLTEATHRLRGTIGTNVAVTFRDTAGREEKREFTREVIHLRNVYARRIGRIGYIHLSGFAQVTDHEFGEASQALLRGGPLNGLVLDLRNNTGGFLDAAVAIVSRFLKAGDVVVRTGKAVQTSSPIAAADKGDTLRSVPLVVLVNGGSASASEIVAAALQDNHRASVVGLVTFGKGLVQTIFPLNGGIDGALSVTTMHYYTPSGRSIQRIGVVPDLLVARTASEARAAVAAAPSFTEAAIYNAPDNEMKLQRLQPDAVEGPDDQRGVSGTTAPDLPLFAQPLPSDAEIAADFQITRALDVLRAGSVEATRRTVPAQLYRRGQSGRRTDDANP